MRILIVNKFLFKNGGSETYIFEMAKCLESLGHEVQFFGMDHPDRNVGNSVDAYTANMDFHNGNILTKIVSPFRIIYSIDSRKKIRRVLDNFAPDVIQLNNINFQITPSIIYEIEKWKRQNGFRHVRVVATIHDPQWVCPNHMLINGKTGKGCEKCFEGKYLSCFQDRCIHNSSIRSAIGAVEAFLYRRLHTYRHVDVIVTPSKFMMEIMQRNPDLVGRVIMLRNFIDTPHIFSEKYSKRYVAYVGRYSEEKGIETLISVARRLPDIHFVFAGKGEFENEINKIKNIDNVGYVDNNEVYRILSGAEFSLIASECYENCPFSVMESIMCETPVIGANIGGIPELICTDDYSFDDAVGELFESGNVDDLVDKVSALWKNRDKIDRYSKNCKKYCFDSVNEYTNKYLKLIQEI